MINLNIRGTADGRRIQNSKELEEVLNSPKLPALPTEDGTYNLQVVVADGSATLSWVKEA